MCRALQGCQRQLRPRPRAAYDPPFAAMLPSSSEDSDMGYQPPRMVHSRRTRGGRTRAKNRRAHPVLTREGCAWRHMPKHSLDRGSLF